MRFGNPKRPYDGEHQIIRRFLWWPLALGTETRWLEWAEIGQCYHRSGYDEDF